MQVLPNVIGTYLETFDAFGDFLAPFVVFHEFVDIPLARPGS